jgi:hypothetical protein
VIPHRIEGLTMLPPVSLPTANPTNPAATAAPGPALEPEEASSGSHGFIVWPLHHDRIFCRHAILKRFRAVGCANPGGIEKILRSPGNAVQRSTVVAASDLLVGFFGLCERQFTRQCNDAVQLRIEFLEPFQINTREPVRRELSLFDPTGEVGQRGESYVCVVRRQGTGIDFAADKPIAFGANLQSGQCRIPARRRRERRLQRQLAGTGAPLVQRRHGLAPTAGRHRTFGAGHLNLHQLFRFSES